MADILESFTMPLSLEQTMKLKMALVKQETINEMLKLESDQQLQEVLLMDTITRTREEMTEKFEKATEAFEKYHEKIEDVTERVQKIRELVKSEHFDKIKHQLKKYKEIKDNQKKAIKREKIEWQKKELARFRQIKFVAEAMDLQVKAKEIEKVLAEKEAKARELWEMQKADIISLVQDWKNDQLAEEQKILDAKKAEEEEKKKYDIEPLEKMDDSFSVAINFSSSWSITEYKKGRRSYEKTRREPEMRRRHSGGIEMGKRRMIDEPDLDGEVTVKRVRFNMNASYRSPTPEEPDDPVPGPSHKYALPWFYNQKKVNPGKGLMALMQKSPKSPNKGNVTNVEKPLFKVPKVPVKKGILKKTTPTPQVETTSETSNNRPAALRRTKSSRNVNRDIMAMMNLPQRVESPKQPLKQFTREVAKSNVVSPHARQKSPSQPPLQRKSMPGTVAQKAPSQQPLQRTPTAALVASRPNQQNIVFHSTSKAGSVSQTPTAKASPGRSPTRITSDPVSVPKSPKSKASPSRSPSRSTAADNNKENTRKNPVEEKAATYNDSDADTESNDSDDGYDEPETVKKKTPNFLDAQPGTSSSFFDSNNSSSFGFGNFFGESTQEDNGLFGSSPQSSSNLPDFLRRS